MKFFSRRPWYADGLAFECVRCGGCCAGPGEGYVWVTDEEIGRIAEFLGMSEEDFTGRHVRRVGGRRSLREEPSSKDCVFLEREDGSLSGCRIYSVRPMQCRTWPYWPKNLRNPDYWALAQARCPGINRGPMHDLAEIQEKRDRTDP